VSYVSTVLADAPLHFWRCADPGGALLHDLGSAPRAMASGVQGMTPYTGPNSDGGSVLCTDGNGAVYRNNVPVASPYSLEAFVWLLWPSTATGILIQVNAISLYFVAGGQLESNFTGAHVLTDPAAAAEQAWHHVCFTYGPTGGARLYKDALLVASSAYFGAISQNNNAALGASINTTLFLNGLIAEAAIYGTELSASRVSTHFLAADNAASRPVFKLGGTFSSSTGGSTSISDLEAQILASVRKTY